MSYSQSSEESYILNYFIDKSIGRFVDIGAYDVFKFSNVRALYDKGWGGVLVEPAPKNFKSIEDHYAYEPRVLVLNVAVGDATAYVDFYESNGDAVGTTDAAHMKKWGDAGVKYTKITVPQVSVVHFFNEYGQGTDFLTIDTESTNIIVFRAIPDWVWEQVQLLCIEHDGHHKEIEEKLSAWGFYKLYFNGENIILGK